MCLSLTETLLKQWWSLQHCLHPLAYTWADHHFQRYHSGPNDPKGNENIICTKPCSASTWGKSRKWLLKTGACLIQVNLYLLGFLSWPKMWPHKRGGLLNLNPRPAEYILLLQTVQIQISWLLKKPTDLDLHCLSSSVWIYSNNPYQVIWKLEVDMAS